MADDPSANRRRTVNSRNGHSWRLLDHLACTSPPPDGSLVTLEADPKHAEVARANIALAGFADKVEVRLGKALETLPEIAAEGLSPFDFIFIDADKEIIPDIWNGRSNCRARAPSSSLITSCGMER